MLTHKIIQRLKKKPITLAYARVVKNTQQLIFIDAIIGRRV